MRINTYNRQIFQTNPPICKVSLSCIENHIQVVRHMSYKDKCDYLYSNGIDYDMVHKYYDVVLQLNKLYEQPFNDNIQK